MAADKLSMGDSRFVKDAANGGLMEVQLGKLAAEKVASRQVNGFGKKMEQDHGKGERRDRAARFEQERAERG